MTALWTSAAIAEATNGTASADFSVSGVAFDSREIGPGDLFIALKGEHSDGHGCADHRGDWIGGQDWHQGSAICGAGPLLFRQGAPVGQKL